MSYPPYLVRVVCLVLAAPCIADAAVVSTTAGARNTLGNDCLVNQSSSGETTISASALCDVGGDRGSAFSSATFLSLTSNSLSVAVSSYAAHGSFGANVYASASASWFQTLVVNGGTGGGILFFEYSGQGTLTGDSAGSSCSLQAGGAIAGPHFCSLIANASFTFGVPFDWLTTLSAETVVPNFSSSTPQAATVDWTVTLQSVTVRYSPLGDVIPGAHVDLVPEPGTVYLAIAGIFICVLRRATVSLTEDAVAVRRAHLESAQPGLRMRVD